MPPPSDHARRDASRDVQGAGDDARVAPISSVATIPHTLAALATALLLAAGALLERPDGTSPGPALGLFVLALALALTARSLGARERRAHDRI